MPTNCAVASCKNIGRQNNTSYFSFPKDNHLRNIWIDYCKRQDTFNPNTSYICSDHFTEEDYSNLMKVRLVGGKLFLKKTSIPTLKYKNPDVIAERYQKRKQEEIVTTLKSEKLMLKPEELILKPEELMLKTEELMLKTEELMLKPEELMLKPEELILKTEEVFVKSEPTEEFFENHDEDLAIENVCTHSTLEADVQINELTKQIEKMKAEMITMQNKITNLNFQLSNKTAIINSLNKRIQYLTHKQSKVKKKEIDSQVKVMLGNIFSDSQLDALFNKKRRVTWSEKDIRTAFTLRYFSTKCYIYLRQTLKYPLPGLSTLRKWANKIHIKRGILEKVIDQTNINSEHLSNDSTITIKLEK